MLICTVFLFFLGMPTDRCGIEQNFCALKSGESRALGIPLIPANQNSDLAVLCLPCPEPGVARREIKFLVVKRIVRNVHLPIDPLYYEKFYFTPGDTGFRAWQTKYGKIGVLVCWDQWYPEGARLTALQGAEILFYPTAIGWHPKEKEEYGTNQHGAWEVSQGAHAVANGCYVAVTNRVGVETPIGGDGIQFWGQSFVAGTSGQILAKASVDKEEILLVPIELDKVDVTRTHWPFLRDRRIDAYGDLTKRFID